MSETIHYMNGKHPIHLFMCLLFGAVIQKKRGKNEHALSESVFFLILQEAIGISFLLREIPSGTPMASSRQDWYTNSIIFGSGPSIGSNH